MPPSGATRLRALPQRKAEGTDRLRHSKFVGLRDDKDPRTVVKEINLYRFKGNVMRILGLIVALQLFVTSAPAQTVQTQTPAPAATAPASQAPELIIDQIKKAVVFLLGNYTATQTRLLNGIPQQVTGPATLAGTGFLVYILDPRLGDRGETFLVTNKHLIREPGVNGAFGEGPYFSSVLMRINTKQASPNGNQLAIISLPVVDGQGSLQWYIDADETVDLAITPVRLDPELYDYKFIQTDLFATKELLKKERVNENDELLFTGLFAWSPGAKKNFPIVRHGKLARLLEERVPLDRNHPEKTFAVHLAEMMSFGGNSGSPVFLRMGGIRDVVGNQTLVGFSYYLLGVMQAFFPEGMDFAIEVAELRGSAAQNSGIAAVIPADKILGILDAPRCQAYRELAAAVSFQDQGKTAEAEKSHKSAISMLEKAVPDHSDHAGALESYAQFLRKVGRTSEATAAEEQAKKIRNNIATDRMHPRN